MARKAEDIKNIVIHCSAGFGDKDAILRYWKNELGWRSVGYHILIERDGTIHQLAPFDAYTNGVKGFNGSTIHICYIGGVQKVAGGYVAKDTRTVEQKKSLHIAIQRSISWLKDNGKYLREDLGVVGHRDYSPDQNGDGVIASWERIKECPSFHAIHEYSHLYASRDRYGKLPISP